MSWWKNAVVYQIYPRSFQDSNGDGIGDLPGIINRLDYFEKLGIDVIWLSPVYQSPNDDNGYDISHYREIHPDFGTMEDMDQLILEAKERNIRVVMDLVVNHTSDEHNWFVEAKKGKDNLYREFYIWRDPVDEGPPNQLYSFFSGSAWAYDETSNQYYMHLFSKKQPDLNWNNEKMRQSVYDMMNFWLDKGISGFRMDVIDLIGKEPDKMITGNGPKLHEYLQEMNRQTFGKYDVMTVGETWGATPENAALYAGNDREELSMVFQFEHLTLDEEPELEKWDLRELNFLAFKKVFKKWQTQLPNSTWIGLVWNNHDTPRVVSRWGNESKYRVQSAKMFAILLHLMKGTPYIYQGEEIGMTNRTITDISQAEDIETINMYHERLEKGYTKEAILRSINAKGRDNARTPMQWNSEAYGGFSTETPWLEVNPNYKEINVKEALENEHSIFYTYRKLIQLRKKNRIVELGDFNLLLEDHPQIFAYERTYKQTTWLVVANFSEEIVDICLTKEKQNVHVLLSNIAKNTYDLSSLKLSPYETFVAERP